LEIGEIKLGGDADGLKALTYVMTLSRTRICFQVTLSYDPKTLSPCKRTFTARSGKKITNIIETYKEYLVGANIPDAEFEKAFPVTPAEKAFRDLDDKILNAKSLRVRYSFQGKMPEGGEYREIRSKGEIILKEGCKVFMKVSYKGREGKDITETTISDGQRVQGDIGAIFKQDGARRLSECMGLSISRMGVFLGPFAMMQPGAQDESDRMDNKNLYYPHEFSLDKADNDVIILTYSAGGGLRTRIRTWYDTKKGILLKRIADPEEGDLGFEYTDTYEEFVLNEDIPDEKFTIKGDK
jgi:hypothetical protein